MKDAKLFAKVLGNTIEVLSQLEQDSTITKTQLWEQLPRVRGCKGGQEYKFMLDSLATIRNLGLIEIMGVSIRILS